MADLFRPRVEESYRDLYPKLNAKNVFKVEFLRSTPEPEPPKDVPGRVLRSRQEDEPRKAPTTQQHNLEVREDEALGSFSLGPTYARPGLPFSNKLANRLTNEPLNLVRDVPLLLTVEYDMDETDAAVMGFAVARFGIKNMTADAFERIMSIIDYSAALISLKTPSKRSAADDGSVDDTQQCAVCLNAESENSNSIVFCDGCDIGVHQDCYGVPFIPEGQWLCRRCQLSRGQHVSCVFCPWKTGAFKQTDTHQWAHVVCGLWIPEAIVPDDAFMEPISGIYNLPRDRWRLKCYVCREGVGACIQCSHPNCYQAFHPTCAQAAGLYMHVEGGTVGALENPSTMRQYCDKHTPTGVKIYTDIAAARKSLEIAEQRGSQSDSLFAVPRFPYWRTSGSGAYAIPKIVTDILKTQSEVDMPDEAINFLCKYWTIKKENMGTMFNRAMKHSLDTAQHVSITRREHAHEFSNLETVLKKRLALAQKLLKIVQTPETNGTMNGSKEQLVRTPVKQELRRNRNGFDQWTPEPRSRPESRQHSRLTTSRGQPESSPKSDLGPIKSRQKIEQEKREQLRHDESEKRKRGRPRKYFPPPEANTATPKQKDAKTPTGRVAKREPVRTPRSVRQTAAPSHHVRQSAAQPARSVRQPTTQSRPVRQASVQSGLSRQVATRSVREDRSGRPTRSQPTQQPSRSSRQLGQPSRLHNLRRRPEEAPEPRRLRKR